MDIIYSEGLKYSTICSKCESEILFKINVDDFNISGKCKKGHFFTKTFEDFEYCCLYRKLYYYIKCGRCYSLIDDQINNFICEKCNLIFCNNCINKHLTEEKQSLKKIYINYNKICKLHKKKYSLFCNKCKVNICHKCANKHNDHDIKSYLDVMPSKKEIESIKETTKNFNDKIEKIENQIKSYKNEILERYEKLNNYLEFLKLTINEKLLKDFNCMYFDYFNYANYKYLSNYLNTEEFFQNNNFIKYLALGKYSDKIKQENKEGISDNDPLIIRNMKDDKKIDFYEKLIYLKDNLFIVFNSIPKATIKLFQFKYKFFNNILSYIFDVSGNVHSIKSAKYSNSIFVNLDNKKNIKIMEYDVDNKTIPLIKNEIKSPKSLRDKYFISYIDDKDGNIITSDENELILWSKNKKSYKEMKKISGKYESLFNISDKIFCGKILERFIFFFEIKTFKVIKKIFIKDDFEIIGLINNNIILWIKNINNLIVIDLKYLEIVQIIETNKFDYIKIQKNYLISFLKAGKLMKIQKHFFNLKEKQFEDKDITEVEVDSYISNNNILMTDNNYFVITNYNNLLVLNI